MGLISIQTAGSFRTDSIKISAEDGGHAQAIQKAIAYLNDRLPEAIKADHKLHDEGERPPKANFGEGHPAVERP